MTQRTETSSCHSDADISVTVRPPRISLRLYRVLQSIYGSQVTTPFDSLRRIDTAVRSMLLGRRPSGFIYISARTPTLAQVLHHSTCYTVSNPFYHRQMPFHR